jgi:hypothetical protein
MFEGTYAIIEKSENGYIITHNQRKYNQLSWQNAMQFFQRAFGIQQIGVVRNEDCEKSVGEPAYVVTMRKELQGMREDFDKMSVQNRRWSVLHGDIGIDEAEVKLKELRDAAFKRRSEHARKAAKARHAKKR